MDSRGCWWSEAEVRVRSRDWGVGTSLFLLLLLSGCAPSRSADRVEGQPLRVLATTGMVADAARVIGADAVEITALMGPGVDPHLYKASERDVRALAEADLVLYNGLHLEGKMAELFTRLAKSRHVVPVAAAIPESLLRHPSEFAGHPDPHVWFDVAMWSHAVERVRDALSEASPGQREAFASRASAYLDTLRVLDAWTRGEMALIPERQRVLVTAHDAFGYFGRAYGVEVVGLQGISTVSEFGLADVRRLVDLIVSRGVKAVFVESSVPRRSIEAVAEGCRARGHDVAIGGTLYSDALGADGTPEGTYVGMFRTNVRTIVGALR